MAGRNPVDPNETPEDRFERLAVARVNRTLHDLKLIGNLASGQYSKTDEQVAKMFGAIRSALDSTESKYLGTSEDSSFTL